MDSTADLRLGVLGEPPRRAIRVSRTVEPLRSYKSDALNLPTRVEIYMRCSLPKLVGYLVILARIPLVAAADGGEDFSNNLFSDLAPILALFGEQVAKQFMAGSTTWEDNIIFAMCPLGIITAMVGAIRIGGPLWLRALIGRARENKAAAEVELTTSTSEDVCEVWNGMMIVRMMGSPRILQLIYIPEKRNDGEYGIYLLDDAAKAKGVFELKQETSEIWKLNSAARNLVFGKHSHVPNRQLGRKTVKQADEETGSSGPSPGAEKRKAPSDTITPAPNIFLNLRLAASGLQQWELPFFALFALALQAGVLVFSGYATYWFKYKKDDQLVQNYAYPLTAGGTILLVMGMWICSSVVERSTIEETWQIRSPTTNNESPEKPVRARLIWLQQGGGVNDQHFDSYALFARDTQDYVLTSRLPTISHNVVEKDDTQSSADPTSAKSPTIVTSGYTRTTVVVGTGISLAGFVIQFTGLRVMHWSATIAQLVATLVMVAVRAWVRRGLTSAPSARKTPQNYELDWIASWIAADSKKQDDNLEKRDDLSVRSYPKTSHSENTSASDPFSDKNGMNWCVFTGNGVKDFKFRRYFPHHRNRSLAHRAMTIRERLGNLSAWTGPASEPAVFLAKAIEAVMNNISEFANLRDDVMTWPVVVRLTKDSPPSTVHLTVWRVPGGTWRSSATQLEAVLSLWLYAIQADESKTELSRDLGDFDDRLRDGKASLKKRNLRLLGPKTDRYLRDLLWYSGDGVHYINEATNVTDHENPHLTDQDEESRIFLLQHLDMNSGTSGSDDTRTFLRLEKHRVAGFSDADLEPPVTADSQEQSQQPGTTSQKTSPKNIPLLAVSSDIPLEVFLAQDMFATFMWAVAEKMDVLQGETSVQHLESEAEELANWKSLKLENTILSKITKEVERVANKGLGTLGDIYLSIIPPLSFHRKLPVPFCIVDETRKAGEHYENLGQWQQAADLYLWLFETFAGSGGKNPIGVQSTAVLFEFLRVIGHTATVSQKQQRYTRSSDDFEVIEKQVQEKLSKSPILPNLVTLFHFQNRKNPTLPCELSKIAVSDDFEGFGERSSLHEDILSTKLSYKKRAINQTDILGLTPLHYAVIKKTERRHGKWLLERGHDRNRADKFGWIPLHYAVARGCTESVETLLAMDNIKERTSISTTWTDISGFTPLHYARDASIVWSLLREGARLDIQGRGGTVPLHVAAGEGNYEVCTAFIGVGANVTAVDNFRMSSLHWAAYGGFDKICTLLMKSGASKTLRDDNGRTPLHLAVIAGKLTDLLLGALQTEIEDLEASDREAKNVLHFAAFEGSVQQLYLILNVRSTTETPERTRIEVSEDTNMYRLSTAGKDRSGMTALHHAAQNGSELAARVLVFEFKADVGAKDEKGWTALHHAAWKGQEDTVRMLLAECNADVHDTDNGGYTALLYAAWANHENIARMLVLEYKADVHARDIDGWTVLHYAAREGHETIARMLVNECKADVNATNNYNSTALHRAAAGGREAFARMLIEEFRADVETREENGWTALHEAVRGGHDSTARIIASHTDLEQTRDLDGWTALHHAVNTGHETTARMLVVEFQVDTDAKDNRGWTALHHSAHAGYEATTRLLLEESQVDIEAQDDLGRTALYHAASEGHSEIVRILAHEFKASVEATDGQRWAPLHRAAHEGQETARTLALECRAKTTARDNEGWTPLHHAASEGHAEIVWLLVATCNVNVEAKDNEGCTPLHRAVQFSCEAAARITAGEFDDEAEDEDEEDGWTVLPHAAPASDEGAPEATELAKMLVFSCGADVEARDKYGRTALHRAVREGHENTVQMLLVVLPVNVKTKDNDGRTALHHAAIGGHERIARMLVVEFWADLEAKDNNGHTPLRVAVDCGSDALVLLLKSLGAADAN